MENPFKVLREKDMYKHKREMEDALMTVFARYGDYSYAEFKRRCPEANIGRNSYEKLRAKWRKNIK